MSGEGQALFAIILARGAASPLLQRAGLW